MPSINSIVSFLFRCLVVTYALLVLVFENNILPNWYYAISFPIYLAVFLTFRKRGKEVGAIVRLINDYAFISLIIFGKELNVINTCFILAPIVNSANYTGQYGLFSSLRLYAAALVCLFIASDFHPEVTWLIPLMLFWVLSNITKGREFVKNMKLILANPVGQITLEQITPYSTHRNRVLKEVVDNFNSNRFLKLFHPLIETAICFKPKGNTIIIVSASRLITDYNVEIPRVNKMFELSGDENLDKISITIDKVIKDKKNYLLYANRIGANNYLYYIEFLRPPVALLIPFIKSLLAHTFGTLSNVFEIEDSIKRRRLRLVKNLKKQAVFLERSTHNIHFINNKLSPILEFFTLKQSIEIGDIEGRKEILDILNDLESKSRSSTNMIVNRLAKHLDKQNNPFFSLQSYKLTVEQIVISIINTWSEHDLSVDFLTVRLDDATSLKKEIDFQSECFEVVLDEIIENIIKYRLSSYNCSITVFTHEVVFRFRNDIKIGSNEDLKLLMAQFNSDLVSEMMKRSSHGISMMKNYLLLMNIKSSLSINTGMYTITLTLPIVAAS